MQLGSSKNSLTPAPSNPVLPILRLCNGTPSGSFSLPMAVCFSLFLCLYLLPGTVSFLFMSSLFCLLESYVSPFLCLFESDSPCSVLVYFQSPCTISPFLSFSVSSSLLLSLLFSSLSSSFSASSFSTSLYYLIH